MKILILGGDGFIGSHFASFAKNKQNDVYVVDKENIRSSRNNIHSPYYIQTDLFFDTEKQINSIITKIQPDIILNCVAVATPHYYITNPIDTFNLDFTLNYNIIKNILKHNIPLIHFSTSEVYGKKWNSIYKEDTSDLTIGPTHKSRWIYASSKILLEQLIIAHNGEHCIVRPQNFCGWDMDWLPDINNIQNNFWKPRLPANMLNNLFSKKPLQVVLPGTQKRCYTHINDAVEGLYTIIDNWSKCKKQTLNIGNINNEITIMDMAIKIQLEWNNLVEDRLKNNFYIQLVDINSFYGEGYEDCERRLFCDKKMFNLTGWKAKINIKDTVNLLIKEALINYKEYLK